MESVNNVMSSIYGAGSPQNFEHISLCGGGKIELNKHINRKYLDEDKDDKKLDTSDEHDVHPMKYGGSTKPEDTIITYANGTYVDDEMFKLMCKTFCLNWYICNARYNTIWVVESDDVVKAYCNEWLDELKKQGYAPGSTEASKYSARSNCRYNKCVFDVYSQNPPNNDGMPYHVDADFPEITSEEILRRTNRDGQVCFFKFKSGDDILCSDSAKFPQSSDQTKHMKLLARCQGSVFILKGDLPKSVVETSSQSKNNAAIFTLAGGAINKAQAKEDFIHEFNKCGHDVEMASYNYFAKRALEEISNGKDEKQVVDRMSKYYTGDHVFNAMKLMASSEEPVFPVREGITDDDVLEMHKMFIDKMSCKNTINTKSINAFKNKISEKYHNACGSAHKFVNDISKNYRDFADLKADVATQYLKKHPNISGINNAMKIMQDMDTAVKDTSDSKSLCLQIGDSCSLNDIIQDALLTNVTSVNAKAYVPQLFRTNAANSTRHILSRTKKSFRGGSIYGSEDVPEPKQKTNEEEKETEEKIEELHLKQYNNVYKGGDEPKTDEPKTDEAVSLTDESEDDDNVDSDIEDEIISAFNAFID